jgi:ParB-like chromosome segregation protein Spo0J
MTTVEDRTKKAPVAPPGTKLSPANKKAPQPTGDPTLPQPGEKEIFVKFEDIVPDLQWNARSPANVLGDSESDSGGGLKELATSMAQTGQDVALVVRPNLQKKGPKLNHNRDGTSYAPFELVNGFRRYAAGLMLNEDPKEAEQSAKTGRTIIPNVPNGHMRVVVRNLDDLQAKLLNGRENVRSPLEPPDLMAHIASLNRPPYSMSVGEIAENQGLSLTTVHKYANVGAALDTEVFKHWRFGGTFDGLAVGKRVSFEDIEAVSKQPKGGQGAAYKALLLGKVEDAQSKDWYVAAQKAASRRGVELARLEKEGVIRLTNKPWAECAPHLIKLPAKAGAKAKEALGKRLADAYEAELAKTGGEKDDS